MNELPQALRMILTKRPSGQRRISRRMPSPSVATGKALGEDQHRAGSGCAGLVQRRGHQMLVNVTLREALNGKRIPVICDVSGEETPAS